MVSGASSRLLIGGGLTVLVVIGAWLILSEAASRDSVAAIGAVPSVPGPAASPPVAKTVPESVPQHESPAVTALAPDPPVAAGTRPGPALPAAPVTPAFDYQRAILVEDPSQQPVPGALVEVWATAEQAGATPYTKYGERNAIWDGQGSDQRPVAEPAAYTYTTDGHGRCIVPLPSGRSVFLVSREEIGNSGLWYAKALEAAGDQPTTITLHPPSRVRGRVVLSDDRPVAGATVRFSDSMLLTKMWFDGRSGRGDARCPSDVMTDAAGEFEYTADHHLMGEAQAFIDERKSAVESVTWRGGTSEAVVTLRFPGRFSIRGIVRGPSGEPLADARVQVARRLMRTLETTSGPDGAYTLDLVESGRYSVAAELGNSAEGADLVMAEPTYVTLTEFQPAVAHDLNFIQGVSISGVARWLDGTPVDSPTLTAHPVDRPDRPLDQVHTLALNASQFGGKREEHSKPDGRFRVGPLHPDLQYDVECVVDRGDGLILSVESVPARTTDLEFVFDPAWRDGTTIAGTVSDARTRAPLEEFTASLLRYSDTRNRIAAIPMGSDAPKQRLEGNGRFAFQHVRFGTRYVLEVAAPGRATARFAPLEPRDGPFDLSIELSPLASLRARVVSPAGDGVAGAAVSWLVPDTVPIGIAHFRRIARTHTDAAGTADIADVEPGEYWLQAFTAESCSEPKLVTVTPGATAEVTLRLESALADSSLTVRVRDRFGAPVVGAVPRTTCQQPGPSTNEGPPEFGRWEARTGADGIAQFEHLPPGLHTVYCTDSDRGIATPQLLVLSAGSSASVELRLH